MNDFEKKIYYGKLIEIYGQLLTKKQYKIMYSYYSLDLSLSEIADEVQISRSAVLDTIQKASNKLHVFENTIQFLKIKKEINEVCENGNIDEIRNKVKELL